MKNYVFLRFYGWNGVLVVKTVDHCKALKQMGRRAKCSKMKLSCSEKSKEKSCFNVSELYKITDVLTVDLFYIDIECFQENLTDIVNYPINVLQIHCAHCKYDNINLKIKGPKPLIHLVKYVTKYYRIIYLFNAGDIVLLKKTIKYII